MSVRRKIAVLSVIGFGACAVLIACFRLIPLIELNDSPDFSYILGEMVIVAALEIQFAIIAINLPSLKALWLRITSGSSGGSEPESSNQKGYKLSSIKRAGNSGGAIYGDWSGRHRSDEPRSITRSKPGNLSTESEEELFRQCGTGLQIPIQGMKIMDNHIEVKTDIRGITTDKEDKDASAKLFLTVH
jgi:hypothetical protein